MATKKTTLKILFVCLIILAISCVIFFGFKLYNNRKFVSDCKSKITDIEKDYSGLETDVIKLNDLFINFKPSKDVDIYNSNYELVKEMINYKKFAIIKITIDGTPRIVIFRDNEHHQQKTDPVNRHISLENLADKHTLSLNFRESVQLQNIFTTIDYKAFSIEQRKLETSEIVISPYILNNIMSINFFSKTMMIDADVLLYFFLYEDYMSVRFFHKSTQPDEWKFIKDMTFTFLHGLNFEDLLTYLICTGLHPIRLEENIPNV